MMPPRPNSTINSNSGGANSIEGTNPATSGVWDFTNTSGTAYWDGAGISNGNLQSVTEKLYYVTGGGTVGSKVTTPALEATASLSQSGLTLTGTGSGGGGGGTVPLPAAVWLLGSGLLGLAGVARRKAKA